MMLPRGNCRPLPWKYRDLAAYRREKPRWSRLLLGASGALRQGCRQARCHVATRLAEVNWSTIEEHAHGGWQQGV